MSKVAFNITANSLENIENALLDKSNGGTHRYFCLDKECTAEMFPRGGARAGFVAYKRTKHRIGCPFENSNKSDIKPPLDIDEWCKKLLEKEDLKVEHGNNVILGKKKYEHINLSYSTQSLYKFQLGKETNEYIDESNSVKISDFVISSRTLLEHNKDSVIGFHLIIGVIHYLDCKGDGHAPCIICKVEVKANTFKNVRIIFYPHKEHTDILWTLLKNAQDKYQRKNVRGVPIAILAKVQKHRAEIPYGDKTKKYICEYGAMLLTNRQIYII